MFTITWLEKWVSRLELYLYVFVYLFNTNDGCHASVASNWNFQREKTYILRKKKKKNEKKKKRFNSRGQGGRGALILLPNMWGFFTSGFQGLFEVNFAEDIQFPQT